MPNTAGQEPVVKTLGISWNSTEDTFTISAANISPELPVTKRNVLRKVATVFDLKSAGLKSQTRQENKTKMKIWKITTARFNCTREHILGHDWLIIIT